MNEMPSRWELDMPDWLLERERDCPALETDDERMAYAVDLARENVRHGGGPFGAAVFERDSGRLVAAGVNLVLPRRCSILHAEIVALLRAQQRLDSHDLGRDGLPPCQLATSCEPCAMCLGALGWAGLAGLLCGARDADAREAGFDEGLKHPDWPDWLRAHGIALRRDLHRGRARAVLIDYASEGGAIYNPGAREEPS